MKTSVIYPYVEKYAKFQELKYSIRSLSKYLTDDFDLFIIGDKPEWLSDEAKFIESPVISKYPVEDISAKMKKIIAREDVSDDFLWMNDDMYIMNPMDIKEACQLRAIEDLDVVYGNAKHINVTTPYRVNMWRTYCLLKENGRIAMNSCTHTPFCYNKTKLKDLLEKYNIGYNKYLISLLYPNTYNDPADFQLIHNTKGYKVGIYTNPPKTVERLKQMTKDSKFFNHSDTGWRISNAAHARNIIEKFLEEKFPDKSKYEL